MNRILWNPLKKVVQNVLVGEYLGGVEYLRAKEAGARGRQFEWLAIYLGRGNRGYFWRASQS
jgi:hypothetical protein